ncbi:MAG: acetylornithine transaminase [Nitrospirota bacterium]|nr:MAG: acetylornithine transaminase [Nitrospirota bacterium]
MNIKHMLEDSNRYLMNTYNRAPIVLRKGRGTRVWDINGNEYIDFLGGVSVNVLGHCHPKIVIALQKQAQRLIHVSNLYNIEPQIELAKVLVELSFADQVFFCNSGAEANEAAIKLARKYAKEHHGDYKIEIITATNSFHGRTITTLSATGQDKLKKGFEPLTPGFVNVEFNNIEDLASAVSENTCAVLLEPIQGEGGVRPATVEYLKEARKICSDNDVLLILDEVQTGIGRTGKLFAYEHYEIEPDIMTLGKGLGGGVPIGAMLAKKDIASSFVPGSHGSTFGGNPLVCASALATIEAIMEDGILLEECNRLGEYMKKRLTELKKEFPSLILHVRGKGLLIGVEINRDCGPIVEECLKRGFLINCTAGSTLRFAPPLIVSEHEIDKLIDVLDEMFGRLQ